MGKTGSSASRPVKPAQRSGVPRWARVCTLFGAVLMLLSGGVLVASEVLIARYEGAVGAGDLFGDQAAGANQRRSDITGPLNILMVGVDPRKPEEPPRADTVMIMHVTAELDRAYLFSLPRDLYVDIPSFEKTGYPGGRDKLNAAMNYGSRLPDQLPNQTTGFELLAETVSDYTGIERFDAGAIVNFAGFQKIVDAMGGVTMYVERDVKSEHRKPDGTLREHNPHGEGYIGPQAVYKKGTHHLKGWQALDYVRQRYERNGVPDGDYGRTRHQQQFVKAMVGQAFSKDVVANPIKLDNVLRAAGESVIFNGRGATVADFGFALRNLRPEAIQMVKLPGGELTTRGGSYLGEELDQRAPQFFEALETGAVDEFLASNPEFLNREK